MRRKDREITSVDEKIAIIEKNKVCRLALSGNNVPYIVPLNYGYRFEDNKLSLYFHSAAEGKKTDIIQANNRACFEIDSDGALIENENPCACGYEFKSIIGSGRIKRAETPDEKIEGLKRLMKHQTGRAGGFTFSPAALEKVIVYTMEVEEFTGKQNRLPTAAAETPGGLP
jgi:nitroimidazol reductase NimA-like FMN-containing flavoprotein (pyridoxamine 5'-phosphate oxidase superfamily)